MLAHFPIAQKDELLTSILARFVQHMGIKDDKIALDMLFNNRMVVPSPLLQGHIEQLLKQVGHIWDITPREIIERHSHLPLFSAFIPTCRYNVLLSDLACRDVNPSMSRAGINASIVNWPAHYKICPLCWREQLESLGFTYWQRLFQSPGVDACPTHRCTLIDTHLALQSLHRHHFTGTHDYQYLGHYPEAAKPNDLKLATMVEQLLNSTLAPVSVEQWTRYYQKLARDTRVMSGKRVDHSAIANRVRKLWPDEWLRQQGLAISGESSWLLAMFRKHRRVYSYLQHLIVWLSLRGTTVELHKELKLARHFSSFEGHARRMITTPNITKRDESRAKWRELLQSSMLDSLKSIRTTVLGARLYSWLYRYDREWLNTHKPEPANNHQDKRVNWHTRDLQLVKKLIETKNSAEERIEDPRHSKSWFALRIQQKSLMEKKLHKLPLCGMFFDRYCESIEEYQVRRLSRVMVKLIEHKDILRPVCEIERLAGLNRKRSRKPARKILRLDIPAWQRVKSLS
ncbi:transcriptional antiterminator [Corallincola holothuriorum]|uniref:Transcriptional antiterminator n=1 Tax=Corallincola holothuriorum TaxID=2282215 RepID=A0A368NKB5_9GAMM|nr:TnsD family Tn7-like transposition protein [Corallincola holothuriorum]RCU51047.1 transcriptional antiterminator [Corallincola holothuriorum]